MTSLILSPTLQGLVGLGGCVPSNPPSSGLIARFRADLGITKDGSDNVSAWADQSGNGYTISQGTGAKQPNWVDSIVNGHPVVRFTLANDDFLKRDTTPSLSQPYTWVIVCARTDDGWFCSRAGGFSGMLFSSGNLALFAGSTFSTGAAIDTAFHSLIGIMNGASSEAFVDNVSTGTGNAGTTGLAGLEIGNADTGSAPFGGDIAEVLVYDHALDSTERTTLDNYVASQYGI